MTDPSPAHAPPDPDQPGIAPTPEGDVHSMPGRQDHIAIEVDLSHCTSKSDLLEALARALHFPDWFGHNWDALADCLMDLSWLPARRYSLTLLHPEKLFQTNPDVLDTALIILDEAATFWEEDGIGFSVMVQNKRPATD
jgi:RNAse (barnase) inhibitor barstar